MTSAASPPVARTGLPWATAVVFRREFGAYFDSSIAYVFAAVFILLAHGVFMNGFFLESVLEMDAYFRTLPLLLVLLIPAITMRTWAEERSHGTIELLMTLPLPSFGVVLGKYFASLVFYLAVLAGSLTIVAMLACLGHPDFGLIVASYLGAIGLGAFFLALGIFISGLTREQIVAFVLSTFACALLVLSGEAKVVEVLDGLSPRWELGTWLRDAVSVLPHYESFCSGVVSIADIGYFALMSLFFLVMNDLTLKSTRY